MTSAQHRIGSTSHRLNIATLGAFLLMGSQPASVIAAPTFTASATITPDTTPYHCTLPYANAAVVSATHTIASSNHFVQIVDEPANAPVSVQYDLNLSRTTVSPGPGGSPSTSTIVDDFYSGLVTCSQTGKYTHNPLNSSTAVMTVSATPYWFIGQSATGAWTEPDHAISSIQNMTTLSQKASADSVSPVNFVYP